MHGVATSIKRSSSNANAVKTSASSHAGEAGIVSTMQVVFCKKVKQEIMRYGVIASMERWRVIGEYMQTEDWWPPVARKVEKVFNNAYKKYNQQQETIANREPAPLIHQHTTLDISKAEQIIASNHGDVAHTKH